MAQARQMQMRTNAAPRRVGPAAAAAVTITKPLAALTLAASTMTRRLRVVLHKRSTSAAWPLRRVPLVLKARRLDMPSLALRSTGQAKSPRHDGGGFWLMLALGADVYRPHAAQLLECAQLDLPHTLAGDGETLADFFQCVRVAIVQAEAHAHDRPLALGQLVQHSV